MESSHHSNVHMRQGILVRGGAMEYESDAAR
jgi:hypothetical protein